MTPPDGVFMVPPAGETTASDGKGRLLRANTATPYETPWWMHLSGRQQTTSGRTHYVDTSSAFLAEFLVYFSSIGEVLGDDMDHVVTIAELPDHAVRQPIPVVVREKDGDVIASFDQAGISMSGADEHEAVGMLAEQIADVFDTYRKEPKLGAWAKKQLRVLEAYIGEKGRKPAKAPRG